MTTHAPHHSPKTSPDTPSLGNTSGMDLMPNQKARESSLLYSIINFHTRNQKSRRNNLVGRQTEFKKDLIAFSNVVAASRRKVTSSSLEKKIKLQWKRSGHRRTGLCSGASMTVAN